MKTALSKVISKCEKTAVIWCPRYSVECLRSWLWSMLFLTNIAAYQHRDIPLKLNGCVALFLPWAWSRVVQRNSSFVICTSGYLPFVQASLEFSPAELVFGHTVRGWLKLLHEQLMADCLANVTVVYHASSFQEQLPLCLWSSQTGRGKLSIEDEAAIW